MKKNKTLQMQKPKIVAIDVYEKMKKDRDFYKTAFLCRDDAKLIEMIVKKAYAEGYEQGRKVGE